MILQKKNQINFNLYKNKINQFELLSIKKSIENNLSFEKSFRDANLSSLKQLVGFLSQKIIRLMEVLFI